MSFNLLLVGVKCTLCGDCVNACTSGALSQIDMGLLSWDKKYCTYCGECMEHCTENAIKGVGVKWKDI